MLILFFKRFSGTVSSYLTFVWKVWEQGGGCSFLSLSLLYSFHSLVHFLLSSWSSLALFFWRFLLFSLCPFCCFHFTPPSWMHPCSSFPTFFFLAPHGMLSLGVQEGDALKTLTDYNTLRDTQQCGPVNASILSAAQHSFCGPSCLDLPRLR